MTPEEKQKECDRICGPDFRKGYQYHSFGPEMCPILLDMWKNPKRKNDYGVEFNHEN